MGQSHPNGFGGSTTAEQVLGTHKLDGKVILITGSNTGIGKETARILVKAGAHIIIAARDSKKSKQAKEDILKETPNASIDVIDLDLGDSKSIDTFVDEFTKLKLPLHILINNAGVMAVPERRTTKDGYEYQNGINHLGHFRLTLKLLPIMIATDGEKRIVCLSSTAHTMCKGIDFSNFHFEKQGSYSPWTSYGQSKVSNLLFAKELSTKLQKDFGTDKFLSVSLHPGVIQTELGRDMPAWQTAPMYLLGGFFLKSIPQGAATTVYAVVSKDLKGGEYLSDCNVDTPNKVGQDLKVQQELWDFSEKAVGISYTDVINSVKKE